MGTKPLLKSATWPLAQSYMLKCAPGGGDSQKRSSLHKKPALVCNAMRDEMAGDVAAERQLIVIERVLVLLPRSRGFRVSADGTVSIYPASKRASRSEQGSKRAATNARTRRSAARAAKHAERREHALSLLSGEAHAPHAGLPGLQNPCHPPERAQD